MSTLSRRRIRPWLMFVGPDVDGGGDTALTAEQFLEKHGYPKDTSTDDMTDGQKAAYWRRKSKGFQKDAENKDRELTQWKGLGEFDAVSTTVQGAEAARQAALTDSQRAQEESERAKEAARAAGQAEARKQYLGDAVAGQLVVQTIRPGEAPDAALARVKGALEFTDTAAFLDDKGNLDPALITKFATSIGSAGGAGGGGDVLTTLMGRQVTPPSGSGGSVADARERTKAKYAAKQGK